MNSSPPAKNTLLAALPILLLLITLSSILIFFPKSQDVGSKASQPQPSPTPLQISPSPSPSPKLSSPTPVPLSSGGKIEPATETVCVQLYNPVCGQNNQTYSNQCTAQKANIDIAYLGECL